MKESSEGGVSPGQASGGDGLPAPTGEHRRRNELQAALLQKAYERSRHAAFVNAALRRVAADERPDHPARQPGERFDG
jgi:hypothetical protein